MATREREAIELGFIAIGGRQFNQTFCRCDPSVNMCPCQYCAEHAVLETAERMADELERLRKLIRCEQIEPPFDVADDMTTELAVALAYAKCEVERLRDELIQSRARCDNERQGSCRGFKTPEGE